MSNAAYIIVIVLTVTLLAVWLGVLRGLYMRQLIERLARQIDLTKCHHGEVEEHSWGYSGWCPGGAVTEDTQ